MLDGQSEAFLARHNVQRGVALYDEAAVSRLRELLDQSVTPNDCARQLGIPNYCVKAFVSAGLLEGVDDRDVEIVRGSGLMKKASIVELRERCKKQGQRQSSKGVVALSETMRRHGAPGAWVAAFDDVVSGRTQHQFIGSDDTSLSEALLVDPTDIARHASHHFSEFEISEIEISCQAAAKIIGTSTQFISASVKIGFLEGVVGVTNSAIPLERVFEFQKNFILGEELRAALGGGHQRSISCELRRAGLEPTATINRTSVWWRSDIEKYIEMQRTTSRAGD